MKPYGLGHCRIPEEEHLSHDSLLKGPDSRLVKWIRVAVIMLDNREISDDYPWYYASFRPFLFCLVSSLINKVLKFFFNFITFLCISETTSSALGEFLLLFHLH
ncbi:MAG: hypothetical protein ACLSA2_09480 [Candidatus Gastranaerophilaceae bacterium]